VAKVWTWDQMLDDFRALGGVADNICRRETPVGLGIFPIDAARPVHIQTPPNLLVPGSDIIFEKGVLRVRKDAQLGERERDFFERYQATFSWGASGRKNALDFVNAMDALPPAALDVLKTDFGLVASFEGDAAGRAARWFLTSRWINSKGKRVVMPVVELVNHGIPGVRFDGRSGVAVRGTFPGEVNVIYTDTDALGFFMTYGFAYESPLALCIGGVMPFGSRKLAVTRNFGSRTIKHNIPTPVVTTDGDTIRLSHLVLGHEKFPRLPRGIFNRVMRDLNLNGADAQFDRIAHINRMRYLKLLGALEDYDGKFVALLRRVCRYQLTALSFAVGAREV
jgi:hypothetical protein